MTVRIYSRVSTTDQNVEPQTATLKAAYKHDVIYEDKFSGKSLDRPEMNRLIADVNAGDTVIFYDISRIGRNTKNVLEFVESMKDVGCKIIIHTLGGIDIASSTGKMVLTTLAAVAEMQRTEILEKQAIGIKAAKADGKYKGKQASPETVKKCKEALGYVDNGMSKEKAAKAVGIGVATLYRYIKSL